jgi:hypothetical protein
MNKKKLKKILKKFIDQEVDPVFRTEVGYNFGYVLINDFIERLEKEKVIKVKKTNIDGRPCECGNKTFIHRHTNWIECTACNNIQIL